MARICMVVHSFYPSDVRVRKEAEALIEADHSVHVICLRNHGEKYRDRFNGVEIHRLPLIRKRGSSFRYIFEYLAFFVLGTVYLTFLHILRWFQIIHVHNMPDFLVFSGLVPRILGSKIVLDVHDPMPELFASQNSLEQNHWFLKIIRLQERISYSFPCALITVNESMRERIVNLGISSDKVITVFNGPDRALFNPSISGGTSDDQGFALVYTGTIARRYGLDIALRAVALLVNEMPDLKLILVGDGNYVQSLHQLAEQLNVRDHVEFRGTVPLEELPGILIACDVCISPHRDDSFWDLYCSTKIFEALAVGLPVISSRTRTIEAYLHQSLFYFEPEDVEGLADQVRLLRAKPEFTRAKMSIAEEIITDLSWGNEKKKLQSLVAALNQHA